MGRLEDDNQENLLLRRKVDASQNQRFLAISYTWDPSDNEDNKCGAYWVESRSEGIYFPALIRDCIIRRIAKYMRYCDLELFWIDRHSLPQKTCKTTDCRPMSTARELCVLKDIMNGELVTYDKANGSFRLMPMGSGVQRAREAIELLHAITSDLWWQRAWTFQENYKAGKKMTLVISHSYELEILKQSYGCFEGIPGELCIPSVDFSRQATRLCQAFQGVEHKTSQDIMAVDKIRSTAGRYDVLLDETESMSPTVVADVEAREITDPWDRLPIVANCCDYPVRLDEYALKRGRHSLSLSILTMCLLNGEVLHNRLHQPNQLLPDVTVSQFLKTHCFNKISAPQDERRLTFNKSCRFRNAKLTWDGVRTKGHLWKLDRIIRTAEFNSHLPWVDYPKGSLTLEQHKYLTQLCLNLRWLRHNHLADELENYLRRDAANNAPYQVGENYIYMMAAEVALAVKEGKTLRLACLWDPDGNWDPYRAIFICDEPTFTDSRDNRAFAFTSLQPKELGPDGYSINDTDRHVSLEVDMEIPNSPTGSSAPHLYVKRWLLGLCFFAGCELEKVVFPWPKALAHSL
ncbi:hypothetical protein F5Y19DRAFT_448942 [Xylariaceae sp. FL1651]|nr:hypothetical protein F5Y19DRAFT_448942 [Xylariaceae sp. FL1651]